mmetsp:Transcript_12019/g.26020  ORF Transcript_12019/g.26020 Transcript_12019/m.26020 type:complete len:83 (+) Transcript_12019:151-399(+)
MTRAAKSSESRQSRNASPSSGNDGRSPSKGSHDGVSSLQKKYDLSGAEEQRQFTEVTGGRRLPSGASTKRAPLFRDGDDDDI